MYEWDKGLKWYGIYQRNKEQVVNNVIGSWGLYDFIQLGVIREHGV